MLSAARTPKLIIGFVVDGGNRRTQVQDFITKGTKSMIRLGAKIAFVSAAKLELCTPTGEGSTQPVSTASN